LAVRQDSLNGVWISSEKSSREPIEPSSERKRMKRSTRDGDKGGELREERERERERGGRMEGRRFASCAASPCSSAYVTLRPAGPEKIREKDETRRSAYVTGGAGRGGEGGGGYRAKRRRERARELSRSRSRREERSAPVSFHPPFPSPKRSFRALFREETDIPDRRHVRRHDRQTISRKHVGIDRESISMREREACGWLRLFVTACDIQSRCASGI